MNINFDKSNESYVGIFWVRKINNGYDTIVKRTPLNDLIKIDKSQDFYNCCENHNSYWETIKTHLPKGWKSGEYFVNQRGRVLYDKKNDRFIVYAPIKILKGKDTKKFKDKIINDFELPYDRIKWATDEHYNPPKRIDFD